MAKAQTRKRAAKKSQPTAPRIAVDHAVVLLSTVCLLAGAEDLIKDVQSNDRASGLRSAVINHDTAALFDWLVEVLSLQGISDQVAITYMREHGKLTWQQVNEDLPELACHKLYSYWSFENCRYEKTARACANHHLMKSCPVPRANLRNGRLNQTAYSLFLFIRDVAEGDLVRWIDERLGAANHRHGAKRLYRLRESLIEPLRNVFGVSNKVLTMALSDLLMAAPDSKPLWFETGASMIVIDTLVHNFLDRTGVLFRFQGRHSYGAACYRPNGCADIIERTSKLIDTKYYNPNYPRAFPRFIQHSIWSFCAQQGLNICNGNNVDDRARCTYRPCPLYDFCERVCLQR